MPDLITLEYATEALDGYLTAEQVEKLPQSIAFASRAIERHCKYPIAARDWARIVRPTRERTERLWAPIIRIDRVAAGSCTALSVINSDPARPRASIRLAPSAAEIQSKADFGKIGPYIPDRLELRSFAAGAWQESTIDLASAPTIGSLAAAVNGLGAGWSASLAGDYGDWPSEDLYSEQGAIPAAARSGAPGASIAIFPSDIDGWIHDPASGVLSFPSWSTWTSAGPCGFYVRWRAGYEADAMPADIKQAVILTIKANLDVMATNLAMQSESLGDYSYSRRSGPGAGWFVPDVARSLLSLIRGRSIKF